VLAAAAVRRRDCAYDLRMRTVADWLTEYGSGHEHPTNKLLHWICVPAIVLSVFGLLWSIPFPGGPDRPAWLNWATLSASAALVYYVVLSPRLAAGIGAAFALLLLITYVLAGLSWPLWLTSIVIFTIAWIGQFLGHAVEGRRPSFFKDLQFLLIGPLWLLAALYRRLHVSY